MGLDEQMKVRNSEMKEQKPAPRRAKLRAYRNALTRLLEKVARYSLWIVIAEGPEREARAVPAHIA